MVLRKARGFKLLSSDMEHRVGDTLTVPDESMSIRDIVNQFVRTGRTDERLIRSEGGYMTDDLDSPDLTKVGNVDFTDRDDLLESVRRDVEEKKKSIFSQKKKRESSRQGGDRPDASSEAPVPPPANEPQAKPKEGGTDA